MFVGVTNNLCLVLNAIWAVVSVFALIISARYADKDYLFFYRYVFCATGSILSLLQLARVRSDRLLGRLSVIFNIPVIFLQVIHVFVVGECVKSGSSESYWGFDCLSLVLVQGKFGEFATEAIVAIVFTFLTVIVMWRCHISTTMVKPLNKRGSLAKKRTAHFAPSNTPGTNLRQSLLCSHASDEFISAAEDAGSRWGNNAYMSCDPEDPSSPTNNGAHTTCYNNFTSNSNTSMANPVLISALTDSNLSTDEIKTIGELQSSLSQNTEIVKRLSLPHDWLKLAWSRSLDSQKALTVLENHKQYIDKWDLNRISISTVKENFKAGFSVKAGRDFDGRPMLWQRMEFMTPATIPLDVGIKSTWLALDAALADLNSNRVGVCLIYDFANVGFKNMTLNLLDVKDGSLACGAGHPSHITRVIFLNPPFVFRMAFNAARPLLPTSVTSVVQMIDATRENWYHNLCPKTQLPEYLGGDQQGDYFSWLSHRLQGTNLLYHPEPIRSVTPETSMIGQ